MKAKRLAIVIASITAITFALTGCQAPTSADKGVTHLSYFSWDTKPLMQPLITEFEKKNPTIKIDFSFAPPAPQYNATLQKRLLAGTAADVYMIDGENRTALIKEKFVTDLTNKSFMSNIADRGKNNGYGADGKVYGMNVSSWGNGLVVNEELLAKVGVTSAPKSWTDFLDLCKKLKESGVTPVEEALKNNVSPILAALVGSTFSHDSGDTDAAIFSGKTTFAKAWAEPLKEYNELYKQGLASPSAVALDSTQMVSEFASGKVAMIVTGPESVAPIKAAAPQMKFTYMPIPGVKSGDAFYAGSASASYAINPKAQAPAAAEKWLAFLSSAKGAEMYNKQLNAITTTTNFTPVVDPSLKTMAAGIRDGNIYWPVIGWKNNQEALSTTLIANQQRMVQGQLTPDQVAQSLDTNLKQLGG